MVFTLPEYNTGFGLRDIPDFQILLALLTFQEKDIQENKTGINTFKYHLSLGENFDLGIEGPRNNKSEITHLLEMKGQACREFESRNGSWEHLINFCYKQGWKFTRIDIAGDIIIDDPEEEYLFDLDKIIYHYTTNQYHSSGFKESFITLGKNNSDAKRLGTTITFGSASSECQLQIYDKKEEQKAKNQGNTNMSDLYVWAVSWTRFEIRFKQGKADTFVGELLKIGFENLSILFSQTLKGLLLFKHRPGWVPDDVWEKTNPGKKQRKSKHNNNRYKWLTCEWWEEHLGNVQAIKIRNQWEIEKSVTKSKRWRERSVSKSLTTYAMADPNDIFDHIADMLEKGVERISKKELEQIEYYKNQFDLEDQEEQALYFEVDKIIQKLREMGKQK